MSLSVPSPDANHCLVELLDVNWVKRVRFGALLLFWTILASPLLANAAGFAWPFLFGLSAGDQMKWVHLIPTVAGCPLLIGVFALTEPWPSSASRPPGAWLPRLLCVLATFEVLHRAIETVSEFVYDITDALWFALPGFMVGVCGTVVGLIYLRVLSRRFGIHPLARGLRALAMCYVAMVVVDSICNYLMGYEQLFTWSLWAYWQWAGMLTTLAILIWALVLLRKFAGHLTRAIGGVCIACGYSLQGLPEPRCPECGQALQVQPTPESPRPPTADLDP